MNDEVSNKNLQLRDQSDYELNPDLTYFDEDPPGVIDEAGWRTLEVFADQIIPSVTVLQPEDGTNDDEPPKEVQSIGAGELGFRNFCDHALKKYYDRKILFSSRIRRRNEFLRKLEKTVVYLDKLAQRDYQLAFRMLDAPQATSCVANLELIKPDLFDYMRKRVMESYFSHKSHKGIDHNHSWDMLRMGPMFKRQIGDLTS